MSGTSSRFAARILRVFAASAFSIALCSTLVHARPRRHSHRTHNPTPSPTATPSALKPVVLIVGGTGSVDRLTGQGPGVLSTAEIYDSAGRSFLPIPSMNERRDQFTVARRDQLRQGSGRGRCKHLAGATGRVSRTGDAVGCALG